MPNLAVDYEEQAAAHPAYWEVVDGAIEGFQDPVFGQARWGNGGAVPMARDRHS